MVKRRGPRSSERLNGDTSSRRIRAHKTGARQQKRAKGLQGAIERFDCG